MSNFRIIISCVRHDSRAEIIKRMISGTVISHDTESEALRTAHEFVRLADLTKPLGEIESRSCYGIVSVVDETTQQLVWTTVLRGK